jgi:hypothetical protein
LTSGYIAYGNSNSTGLTGSSGLTYDTSYGVSVSRITFPATPSYNQYLPNTLYDYEEGTWSPTLTTGSFSSVSYTYQVGRYRKIGSMVYFTLQLSWSSLSVIGPNYSTGVSIPFTGDNYSYGASIGYVRGFPINPPSRPSYTITSITGRVEPYFGWTRLYFNFDNGYELYNSDYPSNGGVEISGTYIVTP